MGTQARRESQPAEGKERPENRAGQLLTRSATGTIIEGADGGTLTATPAREARRSSSRKAWERRGRNCTTNTGGRTSQRDRGGRTTTSRARNARTSGQGRGDPGTCGFAETGTRVGRRGRLDRKRDDVCAANDRQTKSTLLFLDEGLSSRRVRLGLHAFGLAELFGICEDEVHVLVKGEHLILWLAMVAMERRRKGTHLAGHLAPVIQSDAHAPIDLRKR